MNNNYLTVKQLPETERPYEKCEKHGASSLSDSELIATIIRSGTKSCRSIEVAHHVLNYSKSNKGLIGLNYMSIKDFMSIKGIGKVKAIQMLCVAELAKRMAKASNEEGFRLLEPESVARYYMQEMRHMTVEKVMVVFIDSKNKVLNEKILSTGTINATIISPREIFLNALKYNATYIIMLHNHPSGDPSPSKEDINTTKRIKDAGLLIGIKLMDHIIIGDNKYISLKEQGIL